MGKGDQFPHYTSATLNFLQICRDVPSYGVYIIAYEWIFKEIFHKQPGQLPTPFEAIMVGGTAGLC